MKHHKRSEGRHFWDALVDYARAHPSALVMLGNYGRAGLSEERPYDLGHRYRTMGDLNPRGQEVRSLRDNVPRATVRMASLVAWTRSNELERGTRLAAAVATLVEAEGRTLVVTDSDGLRDLGSLGLELASLDEGDGVGTKVATLHGRSVFG